MDKLTLYLQLLNIQIAKNTLLGKAQIHCTTKSYKYILSTYN